MKREAVALILLGVLAGCTAVESGQSAGYEATFATGQGNVSLALVAAEEPEEWAEGLMHREELPAEGMVFVFPDATERTFWMANTSIPLDIIFIRDGRVLNVAEADPEPGVPPGELERYHSDGAANQVVETRQGFSQEHGIGPGTQVWIRPR